MNINTEAVKHKLLRNIPVVMTEDEYQDALKIHR